MAACSDKDTGPGADSSATGDDSAGGDDASFVGGTPGVETDDQPVDDGDGGRDEPIDETGAVDETGADDTGADDTGADETGVDETGEDTAGEDTPTDDTGADDTADDTGADDTADDTGADDTGVDDPACGYGVVMGVVCAPNSLGFINGATVYIDTVDCDGQPLHLETLSNIDGEYVLTGVPAGVQTVTIDAVNFDTNFNVSVTAGQTTDVTDLAYKWCPGAVAPCTTGTVVGNVCPADVLTIYGAGNKVFVETFDCNGDLIYLETETSFTGSFQLSGVPVGTQIVRIQVGGMLALKEAFIEPNKTTDLGATGLLDCEEPEEEDDPCVEDPASCIEPCNCIDDDGDGEIDEGCGFLWVLFCHDGCNCVDDDGDGEIDEDCPDPLDCGPELCNCLDDDGDGKIDESCCDEGDWRYCDENLYCAWGTQFCLADGSWSTCEEIPIEDIPEPCQPFYDFEEEPVIYDKYCCVDAGYCCQDYPEWESIGTCTEGPEDCQ